MRVSISCIRFWNLKQDYLHLPSDLIRDWGFFTWTLTRDSLGCDLQEVVRPKIDAFLLDWITHEPLRRADFWEERNGLPFGLIIGSSTLQDC